MAMANQRGILIIENTLGIKSHFRGCKATTIYEHFQGFGDFQQPKTDSVLQPFSAHLEQMKKESK